MKAIEIKWDLDEEDIEEGVVLPSEIDIPNGMVDDDEISDYLSDQAGYCHTGYTLVDKCI